MNDFRWILGARGVTVGGMWPLINAGALVVITWFDPTRFDTRGRSVPFFVERIDGKQFLATAGAQWRLHRAVWISPDNLRVIDKDWDAIAVGEACVVPPAAPVAERS
jgi:hypothetical protein